MKAFFVSHSYPADEMYKNGVVCDILKAERENPNAKVLQAAVRQKANMIIEQKGCYEVLLADAGNCITEGSRSNVFFIYGNIIVTAPGSSVLLGITRQKAIELAGMLNIGVVEKEIPYSELQKFEAVFLTGTSPKILPVKKIDGFEFNVSGSILRKMINAYDALIEQYIAGRQTV
jgi:branched-chain amino acid aminotransferase